MDIVRKINGGVVKVEKVVLAVMLIVMMILAFLQVLLRFVFKSPLPWSEGLLTYLFVWSSFIGAALGMNTMEHFCIDALVDLLPEKVQRIIEGFIYLLLLSVSVFLVYKGYGLAIAQKMIRMPSMKASMVMPYMCIPVSFCLIAIHSLCNLILMFDRKKEEAA